MDRLRLYKWGAIALLVLNIALVAALVFGHPSRRRHDRLGQAARELRMDPEQEAAFRVLAKAHRADIDALSQRRAGALQAYFEGLASTPSDIPPEVPPAVLAIERQKLTRTYEHFLDVRALLRPDQTAAFEAFTDRVLTRVLTPRSHPLPAHQR